MCKYFEAADEFAIETTQDIDHLRRFAPGVAAARGRMRAHITMWEPEDIAHPSLPTLRAFLDKHREPASRLLNYDWHGRVLAIDATPLLELPPPYLEYRVSPGASFVTHEALEYARTNRHR